MIFTISFNTDLFVTKNFSNTHDVSFSIYRTVKLINDESRLKPGFFIDTFS